MVGGCWWRSASPAGCSAPHALRPAGIRHPETLWRSYADAEAFAGTPEHRAAVRNLYQEGWQHTHFSAIWELHHNHGRIAFCPCGAATPVGEGSCGGCGEALFDVFRVEVDPA